jgi:signal transduction histidine kinase
VAALLREAVGGRLGEDGALVRCLERAAEASGAAGAALLVQEGSRRGLVERARIGRRPPTRETRRIALRVGEETIGVLELAGLRDDPGDALLEAVSAAVALLVRSGQLFVGLQERARELDRQVRQLMALQEVARAVARAGALDPLAAVIADEARRLVRSDAAAVIVRGPAGTPRIAAQEGRSGPTAWTAGLAALSSGRRQVLPGPQAAVPIPGGAGAAQAALVVARHGRPFGDDDLDRLAGLAEQAGVALANVRLVEDLRAEQRRRERLAGELLDAQERERRRVAEDLHDGPVQELAGLALMLDALRSELAADGGDATAHGSDMWADAADAAAAAAEAARSAVGGIRRAVFDLHPMSLEELGFAAAVRVVLDRHVQRGVAAEMEGLAAADDLAPEPRTAAFRIVQEAVANAARHAGARRIEIRGWRAEGSVVVEVADDGRGFDPAATTTPVERGHLGLAAMRERAVLAGAELEVSSRPGEGTRVRARFPVTAGTDAAASRGRPRV